MRATVDMRLLLLLLLTVLAAAARACPPPFNNFRFAGNDTAALIQEAMLENGLGWTEAASHFQNPIQPWPRDSDGIVRIKYCFATPDDRQNFKILVRSSRDTYSDPPALPLRVGCLREWLVPVLSVRLPSAPSTSEPQLTWTSFVQIDQAWNVWKTGIKNPGHSRGHRLIFQEFNWNPAVEWKYCYKDLAGGSTPANWNHGANLPTETIVIIGEDVGVFAQSTLGYTLPALNNAAGRHKVNIHPSAGGSGFSVPLLAHELGHVWGLLHEHQRSDRKLLPPVLPNVAEPTQSRPGKASIP